MRVDQSNFEIAKYSHLYSSFKHVGENMLAVKLLKRNQCWVCPFWMSIETWQTQRSCYMKDSFLFQYDYTYSTCRIFIFHFCQ